jgi:hypothetical protein
MCRTDPNLPVFQCRIWISVALPCGAHQLRRVWARFLSLRRLCCVIRRSKMFAFRPGNPSLNVLAACWALIGPGGATLRKIKALSPAGQLPGGARRHNSSNSPTEGVMEPEGSRLTFQHRTRCGVPGTPKKDPALTISHLRGTGNLSPLPDEVRGSDHLPPSCNLVVHHATQ